MSQVRPSNWQQPNGACKNILALLVVFRQTWRASRKFRCRATRALRGRFSHTTAHCYLPVCGMRSEEHTSELQSRVDLVCRLLLEKKKEQNDTSIPRAHEHQPH